MVTILAFSTGCLDRYRPHPSDKELLDNFAIHEQEFTQLAEMCKEDSGMVRIAPSFLWSSHRMAWPRPESEWGITHERWDDYRELFTKLNIKLGVYNYQPDLILMIANGRGIVTSGSSKGYAYAVESPRPVQIQESLDDFVFRGPTVTEHIYYRLIKDNWYIYLDAS